MKYAALFAMLSIVAALVVSFPASDTPTTYYTTMEPIKQTIIPPCRWDDLCNGYASVARMEVHKYDRTFLDFLGTDKETP